MELSDIQKHVTHFSLELPDKAIQEQQVTVGGRITSIIPSVDEDNALHIVLLDDHLGINSVYISDRLVEAHPLDIRVGAFAFFEGYVHVIKRKRHQQLIKEVGVYAYALNEIKEKEAVV